MEIGKMKKITFILITIFSLVCLFSCEKKTGWGGKKPDIPEKPINGISVDFMVNMIPGFAPRKVTFINMTRGQASRCVFDFGDGSNAEVELGGLISHTFEKGVYNVKLKAFDNQGNEKTTSKMLHIYSALQIKSLTLLQYPLKDKNGKDWDTSGLPDIYFKLIHQNGEASWLDYRAKDIAPSELPYTFKDGFPVTLTNSNFKYELNFYDYDPVGQDEWMGGYYFYIKNGMNKSGNELPGKINFKNSDSELKFELNVNWIL